jgi:hypothetical protein
VIGQRWKRAARTSLTIALLAAVAVVGFTLLGSRMLVAFQAKGNAEQALVPDAGLLNFESPAVTVARLKAKTEEVEKSIKKAGSAPAPLLVKNWRFTQNPIADAFQVSWTAFFFAFYLWSVEEFIDTIALSPQLQLLIDQVVTAFYNLARSIQSSANSVLPVPLRSPIIPAPASPFL